MRQTLVFALCVLFAASLAFAQAGPKKEEKAKPDSTQTKEKAKPDDAKAKDSEKEKAEKEKAKEKSEGKSDEAKKQEKKVEKAAEAKTEETKAKPEKAEKQQNKQKSKTDEAKKEKAEVEKAKPGKPEDKPGKRFSGEEPWSGHLKRAVFTTTIEEREPVGSVDSLSTASEEVLFFTEIVGLDGHTVTHRWVQGGEVRAEVPINVGGPRWRAYSSKKMLPAWTGEWVVEVVDADGSVLGKKSFVYYRPE